MEKLRIIFMGTPEFAVGILDSILKQNYEIVAVITAIDKPSGRGQKVIFSAIKEYALENKLKILQPSNLKDPDFLSELKSINANLQIVVAFRMLPRIVWEMPNLGTFNLHASLLPDYRGAAPINWAIINGEQTTGVTTFFIDDKIDTGTIILSKKIQILPNENAGQLHDKLMNLGSETVLETLKLISNHKQKATVQIENKITKTAHKLNKENCRINWKKPAKEIYNFIRGLSPYPGAWCFFNDLDQQWNVKILESSLIEEAHDFELGQIISSKKELKIIVKEGYIQVLSLQFPGKKLMKTQEFLNGMKFSAAAKVV